MFHICRADSSASQALDKSSDFILDSFLCEEMRIALPYVLSCCLVITGLGDALLKWLIQCSCLVIAAVGVQILGRNQAFYFKLSSCQLLHAMFHSLYSGLVSCGEGAG